jgi:NAD-dependent DNA ligase
MKILINQSFETKTNQSKKQFIKDLMIGDFVIVRRAGDVIPEVVIALPERRDKSIVKIIKNVKIIYFDKILIAQSYKKLVS